MKRTVTLWDDAETGSAWTAAYYDKPAEGAVGYVTVEVEHDCCSHTTMPALKMPVAEAPADDEALKRVAFRALGDLVERRRDAALRGER